MMNKLARQKLLLTLFSVLTIVGIFYACRKINPAPGKSPDSVSRTKFFDHNNEIDPTIKAILLSIKRQDDKRNFLPRLIKNAGYALWNKAKVFTKDETDEKQVFIPFVPEGKSQTRALLIVKLEGTDTLYHLLYSTHYKNYSFDTVATTSNWKARDIFRAFLIFDNEIFGHTEFLLQDNRLLGSETNTIANKPVKLGIENISTSGSARLHIPQLMTIWITYVICNDPLPFKTSGLSRLTIPAPCYNPEFVVAPVVFWIDDGAGGIGGEEGEGWGWYPPEEPGGGGGGSDPNPCAGCSWEQTNPCYEQDPNEPQVPCDDNWQPITGTDPTPFNPYLGDSVYVSDYLRDSFPCVFNFIHDSMGNANVIAQLAGADVFNDEAYMHLKFDTSAVYTDSLHPSGVTRAGPNAFAWVGPDSQTHYTATIRLNPWHLKYATKEYIISTILHECMHAIFTLRWGQYQRWLTLGNGNIDSAFIKLHFPIHWYYIMGQSTPLTALQDHEIMAAEYADRHANILRQYFNPAASTAIRDTVIKAMGYGGLHKTSAWKLLPGLGIDTCKYLGIQIASEISATGSNSPTGCTGYNYHHSNDLKLRKGCN